MRKIIWPHTYSNEAYSNYLRYLGADIGKNVNFVSPKNTHIDINYCKYIKIGDNCCLSYVTILAHDFSWYVLLDAFNDFVPSQPENVTIGKNCFIGYKACILKGTSIGDNVVIGAYSLVKGIIPSNTVWAGNPARQICTLEEYRDKLKLRLSQSIEDGQNMEGTAWNLLLYLDRTQENFEKYIKNLNFNGIDNNPKIRDYFFNSDTLFAGGGGGNVKLYCCISKRSARWRNHKVINKFCTYSCSMRI